MKGGATLDALFGSTFQAFLAVDSIGTSFWFGVHLIIYLGRWPGSNARCSLTAWGLFNTFHLVFVNCYSPNRFTCEGFLLLLKGCMLGPDDFEFVSGLVFLAA